MQDFIDPEIQSLFAKHQLDSFAALWALDLEAVDRPNIERGGWSSVSYLELDGQGFYLKRQINHLTRSLCKPLGEPTFAREFRTIEQYRKLAIPALTAAWFGQRKVGRQHQAILVTHALTGWQDLDSWMKQWLGLDVAVQQGILQACGCFYPKHIFLQHGNAGFEAQLIDLEKTRPLWLGRRDRIKDLEPLLRRTSHVWTAAEHKTLLLSYLQDEARVEQWYQLLLRRRADKDSRP